MFVVYQTQYIGHGPQNGKFYIGCTTKNRIESGQYVGSAFNDLLKMWGRKAFDVEILAEFDDKQIAENYESVLIYNTLKNTTDCINVVSKATNKGINKLQQFLYNIGYPV